MTYDFLNRPAPTSSLPEQTASPLDEITRLRELINRANSTNSTLDKRRVVSEFDDLRPLLAFLYDPYCRLHVTSDSVHKYLRQRKKDKEWLNEQAPVLTAPSNRARNKTQYAALRDKTEQDAREQMPETLLELFYLLASRQITGNEAMATIHVFLQDHGILEQHEYALSGSDDPNLSTTDLFRRGLLRPTALEIFYRCLDRNLKAGVREKTICYAFTGHEPHRPNYQPKLKGLPELPPMSPTTAALRQQFEVALGNTLFRAHLPTLFSGQDASKWYASRKLDGVRCIIIVRLQPETSPSGSQTWKVMSISSLSRNGRPFSTLAVLEREISTTVTSFPGLSDLLGPLSERDIASSANESRPSPKTTLILDGEVCVLRPPDKASSPAAKQLDASITALNAEPANQELAVVEDFAAVVGLIKRKEYTIPDPAFFPFDLLTLEEFVKWRSRLPPPPRKTGVRNAVTNGINPSKQKGRIFSERLAVLESLVSHFEAASAKRNQPSPVRRLTQHSVSTPEQVEEMLGLASERGWEGIVLRKDMEYEGKRTSAIRKFKQWRDAEYKVVGITTATMRLPINGRFEEREALSAIQIVHKGTRVSVGSGFTSEQRVEFARDPEKIIGKAVTVEYFDESKTFAPSNAKGKRDGDGGEERDEVYSLRFPRIKHIWGQKRDV